MRETDILFINEGIVFNHRIGMHLKNNKDNKLVQKLIDENKNQEIREIISKKTLIYMWNRIYIIANLHLIKY